MHNMSKLVSIIRKDHLTCADSLGLLSVGCPQTQHKIPRRGAFGEACDTLCYESPSFGSHPLSCKLEQTILANHENSWNAVS